MPIPGRRPKPKGESPPKGNGVVLSVTLLECPAHLDKHGRQHWEYYVPLLAAKGFYTALDRGPFTLICEAWSFYMRARTPLKRSLVTRTKTGYEQQRPQYTIMKQAWDSYFKIAEQYGLTPVSRIRLNPDGVPVPAGGPDPDDDIPDECLD